MPKSNEPIPENESPDNQVKKSIFENFGATVSDARFALQGQAQRIQGLAPIQPLVIPEPAGPALVLEINQNGFSPPPLIPIATAQVVQQQSGSNALGPVLADVRTNTVIEQRYINMSDPV